MTLLSNRQVIWFVKVRFCWNNKRNPINKLEKPVFEQEELSFTKWNCKCYTYGFIALLILFPVILTAHLLLQQGYQSKFISCHTDSTLFITTRFPVKVISAFWEIGCKFSNQKAVSLTAKQLPQCPRNFQKLSMWQGYSKFF